MGFLFAQRGESMCFCPGVGSAEPGCLRPSVPSSVSPSAAGLGPHIHLPSLLLLPPTFGTCLRSPRARGDEGHGRKVSYHSGVLPPQCRTPGSWETRRNQVDFPVCIQVSLILWTPGVFPVLRRICLSRRMRLPSVHVCSAAAEHIHTKGTRVLVL